MVASVDLIRINEMVDSFGVSGRTVEANPCPSQAINSCERYCKNHQSRRSNSEK
jgi:hypothetical protein